MDLGPFRFEEGHVYELSHPVATLLLVWVYAERIADGDPSGEPIKQFA